MRKKINRVASIICVVLFALCIVAVFLALLIMTIGHFYQGEIFSGIVFLFFFLVISSFGLMIVTED